jgi:hypothetical protein
MTDQTISELLILFLLAITCARIFYQRQVRSDALAILPSVALIICILYFFAWGVSLSFLVVFVLTVFVFIWNTRALLRLNAQLVIDHYSPWFLIISIINLILVVFAGIFIFSHRPIKVDQKKTAVVKTISSYAGTFTDGFQPLTKPFQKTNVRVWKYTRKGESQPTGKSPEPAPTQAPQTIILFMPDKCATPAIYEPMLIRLATDGYIVYTADFTCKDLRWFNNIEDSIYLRRTAFLNKRIFHTEQYPTFTASLSENLAKEYTTLVQFATPRANDVVLLVGDQIALKALPLAISHSPLVDGTFDLATVNGYTTPGLGPIEQTDPLLAHFFGYERESSQYMSVHLATAIEHAAKELSQTLKAQAEDTTTESKPAKMTTAATTTPAATTAATETPITTTKPTTTTAGTASTSSGTTGATPTLVVPSVTVSETTAAATPAATATPTAAATPAATTTTTATPTTTTKPAATATTTTATPTATTTTTATPTTTTKPTTTTAGTASTSSGTTGTIPTPVVPSVTVPETTTTESPSASQ